MWKRYFPCGTIHGLDLTDKHGPAQPRITTVQAAQSDGVYGIGLLETLLDNPTSAAYPSTTTWPSSTGAPPLREPPCAARCRPESRLGMCGGAGVGEP